MSESKKISVVWTNDDIGVGDEAELRRQLEFLDEHGIPGVFFIIPSNSKGNLDQDDNLLTVITEARKNGHEFYQHGYKHFAFECGIPCLDMFSLDMQAKSLFDADRDAIEALHSLKALTEMLENGRSIWLRAFGETSEGFRPGWGSYCGNLYKALHTLGYRWVSSRIPSMTAMLQKYGEPIEFSDGVETGPHRLEQGIWEFPVGPEIAWRVPNNPQKIDAMVELGLRHFDALRERNEPMLMLSHYHGLEFTGASEGQTGNPLGTGYALHEKFLSKLLATGQAEFIGMKELTGKYL